MHRTPRRPAACLQQHSLWQLSARAGTLRALRERGDAFGLQAALRIDYVRQAGRATSRRVHASGGAAVRLLLCLQPASSVQSGKSGASINT